MGNHRGQTETVMGRVTTSRAQHGERRCRFHVFLVERVWRVQHQLWMDFLDAIDNTELRSRAISNLRRSNRPESRNGLTVPCRLSSRCWRQKRAFSPNASVSDMHPGDNTEVDWRSVSVFGPQAGPRAIDLSQEPVDGSTVK